MNANPIETVTPNDREILDLLRRFGRAHIRWIHANNSPGLRGIKGAQKDVTTATRILLTATLDL